MLTHIDLIDLWYYAFLGQRLLRLNNLYPQFVWSIIDPWLHFYRSAFDQAERKDIDALHSFLYENIEILKSMKLQDEMYQNAPNRQPTKYENYDIKPEIKRSRSRTPSPKRERYSWNFNFLSNIKGIVNFEMSFWCYRFDRNTIF